MVRRSGIVKRPVNLSLNASLVAEARAVTNNLSEVVEKLLVEYVANEHARLAAHDESVRQTVDSWNAFSEEFGSFADEHSTL